MINVSDAFRQQIKKRTDFTISATMTLFNGTVTKLPQDAFTIQNNNYTDGAGVNSLPLGVCVCKSVQIELDNSADQYADVDFLGAIFDIKLNYVLDSGAIESVNLGTFTVSTPETYGSTVIITALDDIYRTDRPFSTTVQFPTTADFLLEDICRTCGILCKNLNFRNHDWQINEFTTDGVTFRQVIGYIAGIAGGNARINRDGYLEIVTYDTNTDDVHTLDSWKNLKIDTDDVVITGVQVNYTTEDNKTASIQYGESGYVVTIDNPLVSGHERAAAETIGNVLIGMTVRKFSGDYISYPLAEFMDVCIVQDWKGNQYRSVITDIAFVVWGYTTLSCSVESAARNSSTVNSAASKALIQARKMVQQEKTQREAAMELLQKTFESSSGMYTTSEVQPDGSTVYYTHDKPTLAESKYVTKYTAAGIAVSTDGGKTYPYGYTVDGSAVLQYLATHKLTADYIDVGAITADKLSGRFTDGNGSYWDLSRGEVRIDATSFYLFNSGSGNVSINEYLANLSETAVSDALKKSDYASLFASMQAQLDGKTESYYQETMPGFDADGNLLWTDERSDYIMDTLGRHISDTDAGSDDDESHWLSGWYNASGASHEGDLWRQPSTGKDYIFYGGEWILQENPVPDEVYDKIAGKAQIFVTTPKPPYAKGDLWMQGNNADILTCTTARAEGDEFTRSDWVKYNKYTDDTTANAAQKTADETKKEVSTLYGEEVFNRLTNNGTIRGITLENNALYINADYIKSGTLTAGGANNVNGTIAVYNASGMRIGLWDNSGITVNGGTINTATLNAVTINSGDINLDNGLILDGSYSYVSQFIGSDGVNTTQGIQMGAKTPSAWGDNRIAVSNAGISLYSGNNKGMYITDSGVTVQGGTNLHVQSGIYLKLPNGEYADIMGAGVYGKNALSINNDYGPVYIAGTTACWIENGAWVRSGNLNVANGTITGSSLHARNGFTGTLGYIEQILANADGSITWYWAYLEFADGILTSKHY